MPVVILPLQEGAVPLLAACLAGHIETARLLLEQHYSKDPSELPPADAAKNTLLHMCVIGNPLRIKELLEVMKSVGYTTQQLQELVGSVNVVRCLLVQNLYEYQIKLLREAFC